MRSDGAPSWPFGMAQAMRPDAFTPRAFCAHVAHPARAHLPKRRRSLTAEFATFGVCGFLQIAARVIGNR